MHLINILTNSFYNRYHLLLDPRDRLDLRAVLRPVLVYRYHQRHLRRGTGGPPHWPGAADLLITAHRPSLWPTGKEEDSIETSFVDCCQRRYRLHRSGHSRKAP